MHIEDNPVQISILVAARNEEANIARCLRSLSELDFPVDQIEILIGDDDSEDRTASIIQDFIQDKPHFHYNKISYQMDGLRGKANVLEQLSFVAKGKYFLYCDADIAVPSGWVGNILAEFRKNTGVVVGLTRMRKSHIFADFLSLEWLFTLTVTKLASYFKVPITGMGNNMAVTREAYEAVGGYGKLGFSIVEDYALFMAIVNKGYNFRMAFKPEILSVSEPINTFSEYISQRRRWMQGVMQSFWVTKYSIILSAFFIPTMLIMAFWYPETSFLILFSHYCLVTITAISAITILRQNDLWKVVLLFWFYMFGNTTVMLFNYFSTEKMKWKGREY